MSDSDDHEQDHDHDHDQEHEIAITQLPALVKEWMATNEEIKNLSAEVREKRKHAKQIHQMILKIMKGGGIGKLNIASAGAALIRTKRTKAALTKKYLITTLTTFFKGNEELAKECAAFLESQRTTKTIDTLNLEPV